MPITAVSSDGVEHEFPDGTDQAVIGKVMKTYATQHTAKATAAPAPEKKPDPGLMSKLSDAITFKDYREEVGKEAARGKAQAEQGVADFGKDAKTGHVIANTAKIVGGEAAQVFAPITAAMTEGPGRMASDLSGGRIDKHTAGDVASFAIPVAGELAEGRALAKGAQEAGVGVNTLRKTLDASKAPSGATAAPKSVPPIAVQSAQPNRLNSLVEDFDKARVRPSLAAMGDGNARVAKAIAENPIAGVRVRAALKASLVDTEQAVGRVAEAFGTPADRGAAGEAAQKGIEDFNDRFSKRASAMYDKAFEPINQAHGAAAGKASQDYALAKVQSSDEAENAQAALNLDYRNRSAQATHGQTQTQIDAQAAANLAAGRRGTMPSAVSSQEPYVYPADKAASPPLPQKAAVIQPSATATTLARINARGDAPALKNLFSTPQVQTLTKAIKDPASLSFQDLRDARTWVRNAQRDDTLRQGVSQSDLQQIEGSLTQDINANAEAIAGPQAARQLKQADQFYRLGSERIQGALQAFVGKGGSATGESAFDMIQRAASDRAGADIARLRALKNSLPAAEWGDIAASTVKRMGQSPSGEFSVNSLVTNADKLSPQGKSLLFGDGELRQDLDRILRVAKAQKGVERAANHSNTASAAQSIATVGGLAQPHTAIPTGAALAGMGLTGEALTNPAIARMVATGPQNTTVALGRALLGQRGSPLTGRNYLSQITRQSSALAPPRPMLALPAAAIASQAGSQ